MTRYRSIQSLILVGLMSAMAASLGAIGARVQPAAAATPPPTIDYQFDGDLSDSKGGSTATPSSSCSTTANPCIDTTSFGSNGDGGYWQWTSTKTRGGGLEIVTNSPVGQTYTAILKFSFRETGSGYKKIIDYKNRASDTGFYFLNKKILFYNLGSASSQQFNADEVIDLIIVRDGTTDKFTVYLRGADGSRGAPVIDITDSSDQSVFASSGSGSIIGLFYDDNRTTSEGSSGGKAYEFKLWAGVALTADSIDELLAGPPVTDPPVTDPPVTDPPVVTDPPNTSDPLGDFDGYRLPEVVQEESLPNTGRSTTSPIVAIAILLILAGAFVAYGSRRASRP